MERQAFFSRLLMAVDAVVMATAFILSYSIRSLLPALGLRRLGPLDHYLGILLVAVPLWWVLLFLDGAYTLKVEFPGAIIKRGLKVGTIGLLTLSLFLYLIKFETFNRSLLILFVFMETALLVVARVGVSSWLAFRRRTGRSARHALIVTADEPNSRLQTSLLIMRMQVHAEVGVVPVGCLSLHPAEVGRAVEGVPIRGVLEELPDLLHEEVVDEVYFVLPPSSLDRITDYLKVCEEMGVEGKVLAELYRPVLARPYVEESFGLPFFSFSPIPARIGQRYVKAVIDLFGALVLLALLALPMAAIALLIKLSSKGPVLFQQERGGLHGRRFFMYKFRTMVPEAEQLRERLLDQNEMSGPVFKLAKDPRLTPLGRWLRRMSLDELPQLINVLRGEMSLVGPRPLPLVETAQIKGPLRRRLSMKPGITGLWQCSGRSNLDFDEWMRLDLEYVDNWSLLLDFKILVKTIPAVLSGKGAR